MSKSAHFIIMPTLDCNLSCDYCFSNKKNQYMPEYYIYPLFNKIKSICDKLYFNELNFYFQGGEVLLLDPSWFETMFKVSSYLFNRNDSKQYSIKYSIQTNITLYNSDWSDLIHKIFNGNVNTSFDYPNIYRKEMGHTAEEFENLWIEKKNSILNDGLKLDLISIPNIKSIELGPEDFFNYYINEIGVKNFCVNFPFTTKIKKINYNLDINQISQFMISLFNIWFEKGYKHGVHIRPFDSLLEAVSNTGKRNLPCLWSTNCTNNYFSIGPDGNVSLCDCWISSNEDFSFGNIFTSTIDEIIDNHNRSEFFKRQEYILNSECIDCPYCSICFGGCIIRGYSTNNSMFCKDYYCEVYKNLFSTAVTLTEKIKK